MVDFYDRVSQPVLTDIEIELEGIAASDLFPENIPDMFQGSSLILLVCECVGVLVRFLTDQRTNGPTDQRESYDSQFPLLTYQKNPICFINYER